MKCERSENWISLEFEEQEKELLLFSLEEIEDHYAQDISILPEKLRSYWKGRLTGSIDSENELADSTGDLEETRLEWKSERWALVRKWLAEEGSLKVEGGGVLVLDETEAEQFLSVLNDRRLLLALEYDLDEDLMSRNPPAVAVPEVQQALWEVHFLAIVQQHILETLDSQSL